jgi:hypothetical protein
MYRYCAWPALLSGKYRTQYRDVEGAIHDFTPAPVQTPSFLLEALKGPDNSPATELVQYRMMPYTHPCPDTPPGAKPMPGEKKVLASSMRDFGR